MDYDLQCEHELSSVLNGACRARRKAGLLPIVPAGWDMRDPATDPALVELGTIRLVAKARGSAMCLAGTSHVAWRLLISTHQLSSSALSSSHIRHLQGRAGPRWAAVSAHAFPNLEARTELIWPLFDVA